MSKEFDAREHPDRLSSGRQRALHEAADEASALLPGGESVRVVSFDRRTGNAAVVVSRDAVPEDGDYVRRALRHVQRIGGALGLGASQPPEFSADPDVQRSSVGAAAVHLRQQYKGIAIYEASETVRFEPDGRLAEVAGRTHTVDGNLPSRPAIPALQALRVAAQHLARPDDDAPLDPFGQPLAEPPLDLSGFDPQLVVAGSGRPDAAITYSAPPFEGPVEVSLLWFPLDDDLRLAWHLVLQVPGGGQYRVLIDAGDGRLLLAVQLLRSISGRATVFLRDGGQPGETVEFPLPLDHYGVAIPDDLPDGFPAPWLLGDSTDGANVRAALPDGTLARGRDDDGTVVFDAAPDAQDNDQLLVNLFALNGLMHDLLYLLGFREAEGNFQRDNAGRGGRGADAVQAVVHPGTVWGTANMATPTDGSGPRMNMGLVAATGRHTGLDAEVVIHEYTHGLTNRLVGGPMNASALDGDQGGAMGEGWGDYFACLLSGRDTVGSWVVNRPQGIRMHRYTDSYPGNYGDLGRPPYTGVHAAGEVWCATLLALDRRIGRALAPQLVVDALKLSAANPSFLAMRDAILLAGRHSAAARQLSERDAADLDHRIWEAFAKFGMGPGARTNGDTLTGIVADFSTPPRPQAPTTTTVSGAADPHLPIPDNSATGVSSTIELAATGALVELSVAVDIAHPYQGDLVVTLAAPGGSTVTLHDRGGGRADDLKRTWTSATHPGLATLTGGSGGGRWTLRVADRAALDRGILHSWSLDVGVAQHTPEASVLVEPALAIPDDDPAGVSSSAELQVEGTLTKLDLAIDITHAYVGDVVVSLRGPSGREVTVSDRDGAGHDNLISSYTSAGGPLAPFVGEPADGTWVLTVADHAGADIGKLNRWRLTARVA